jgi:hypothetical protein
MDPRRKVLLLILMLLLMRMKTSARRNEVEASEHARRHRRIAAQHSRRRKSVIGLMLMWYMDGNESTGVGRGHGDRAGAVRSTLDVQNHMRI